MAALSCAPTSQILKFNLPKHFLNSRCPSLIAPYLVLDASSSVLVDSPRKLQVYNAITGRLLQKDAHLVVYCGSVASRQYATGGANSGHTSDADDDNNGDSHEDIKLDAYDLPVYSEIQDIEVEIEKTGKNSRRIRSKVAVQASLQTVWDILTDYERLADFIPSLAVSQVLEKRENFARLFQIGQQDLAFGLKFNAKGTVDCFEKDLQTLPFGQKRDIEFNMVEGDFQQFEGKWSVEQQGMNSSTGDIQTNSIVGQEFQTTLLYVVDVKPKLWLPVRLVEDRLCREIRMNLSCIRSAAEKAFQYSHDSAF